MTTTAAETRLERIETQIFEHPKHASLGLAGEIADLIRQKSSEGKQCVLGLATGSTPVTTYRELVRMHKEEGLSFQNVITFNLDEYFPMNPASLQSYHLFMRQHLFDHIDIPEGNINIPSGTVEPKEVAAKCEAFETKIRESGGIDIQVLGIGRTGHIGFNEPGSSRESRTRLITLDKVTRLDAASDFFGEENVPHRAITMGVGTILEAHRVVLMAFGENKAPVIAQAIEGAMTPSIAASFLQEHKNAQIFLDYAAAAELTRRKAPWLLDIAEWDDALIRRAVIWLARKLDKPILKLTSEDYNESGLQDLLAEHGPANELNVSIFRQMQRTISGWPGGKPAEKKQPGDLEWQHDSIYPKKVLIFSPHPDDDVISMGGTLIRLVDQGHAVHVAYQTSGNIAVFDEDATRFVDFATDFNQMFGMAPMESERLESKISEFLKNKAPGQVDSPEVLQVKGLIRRGEALAAGRCCGLFADQLHFLDLPFYETGTIKKEMPGQADLKITVDILREIQPNQIYAAGDLSDPHGTHRTCLGIIFAAIEQIKNEPWYQNCVVWLYRGAWQEWDPDEVEMAVPLSPNELMRKRVAVFKHESQKDRALFPGLDEREFWQRAEDRNRATASLYDRLGMAEYEAIEGFVRWKGDSDGIIG